MPKPPSGERRGSAAVELVGGRTRLSARPDDLPILVLDPSRMRTGSCASMARGLQLPSGVRRHRPSRASPLPPHRRLPVRFARRSRSPCSECVPIRRAVPTRTLRPSAAALRARWCSQHTTRSSRHAPRVARPGRGAPTLHGARCRQTRRPSSGSPRRIGSRSHSGYARP